MRLLQLPIGMSCVIVGFIPKHGTMRYVRVGLGIFGKCMATATFEGISVWSNEVFPTSVRMKGIGFVQVRIAVTFWPSKMVLFEKLILKDLFFFSKKNSSPPFFMLFFALYPLIIFRKKSPPLVFSRKSPHVDGRGSGP